MAKRCAVVMRGGGELRLGYSFLYVWQPMLYFILIACIFIASERVYFIKSSKEIF